MNQDNEELTEDRTNWKAWYWALVLILLIQIVLYYFITKQFVL